MSNNIKRAIKARMAATGETYTQARAAVLATEHTPRPRLEVQQFVTGEEPLPDTPEVRRWNRELNAGRNPLNNDDEVK